MRRLLNAAALAVLMPSIVAAQGSQFGVRGLGHPGRETSIRSLATGGSFAPMDELSVLNPAAIGALGTFTATFTTQQDFRTIENALGSNNVRTVRFPLVTLGGPIRRSKFAVGLSLATYLNRDYSLATQDTLSIRGAVVPVFDTLVSQGGVSDFRFATSYRFTPRGSIGLGLHLLSGSTRNEFRRTFFDTSFVSGRQRAELSYQAFGLSVGVVQQLTSKFVVAGSARYDTPLKINLDSTRVSQTALPVTLNGGFKYRVAKGLDVAASGTYRTWSKADADLVAQGAPGAVSTIEGAAGLELATGRNAFSKPLRAGIRYASLPFYVTTGAQAHEIAGSLGTGQFFGNSRASVDLALEYLRRSDGTGRRESSLVVSAGISVRP